MRERSGHPPRFDAARCGLEFRVPPAPEVPQSFDAQNLFPWRTPRSLTGLYHAITFVQGNLFRHDEVYAPPKS